MNQRIIGLGVILVVLSCLGWVATAKAVYDPGSSIRKGQRWAISAGLRAGYDDNPLTASSGVNKSGSFFNGLNLNGSYSYPTDTTFISVRTGANGAYYFDHPGSSFDFNNAFDFTLAHTFSPRLNLDLADHLRFGQEPQLAENNTIVRRQGDYVNNGVNTGLSYQFTSKWFLDAAFSHDLWSYQDSDLAAVLDRQTFSGGPSVRYRLTEKTTLSLNYRFTSTQYDQSPRNANSHTITAGISQSLTRRWNASLDAGGEIRDEDNAGSTSSYASPYVNFGTSYLLSEKATLSGGIRYSYQETDLSAYYMTQSLASYGRFRWEFARNLSASTGLDIINNDSTASINSGTQPANEWTYLASQRIDWSFRENISLSLSYTFTRFDSPIALRGYDRNIIEAGANYTF